MALSMTGYGREKTMNGDYEVSVEIKSVNNRYFDANIRVPKVFNFLEEKIRKYLSERINRGKVDVFVFMKNTVEDESDISYNEDLAKKYYDVFKEIAENFDIPFDLTATKLGKMNDIFTISQKEYSEDEIFEVLKPVLDKATDDFIDMRKKEGKRLEADVLSRIEKLKEIVAEIEKLLPQSVKEYEERLRSKLDEYLKGVEYDEQRVLTEVAIFSDKVATFEETTRLKSHFEEFVSLVTKQIPVGKKLDFIIQEMNREVNTTCSKCQSIEISKLGIEAKSEIEAIREQIQNIE